MAESPSLDIGDVGTQIDEVDVVIGPRFLDLFSKHLYRSPNKAFEELVSNSWDAGATTVHISLPSNLSNPKTSVWVLDNGESMDAAGLKRLWQIADSNKPQRADGRPQIGKFGIGKLATYLLAQRLTYICKGADGVVRSVEMDYSAIDNSRSRAGSASKPDMFDGTAIKRVMRSLSADELSLVLSRLADASVLSSLIAAGVPRQINPDDYTSEFGSYEEAEAAPSGTWTLAILSSLKELGQSMQPGWIRYMLRSALPLGDSMSIIFNQSPLTSTKVDKPLLNEIVIGAAGFPISRVEFSVDPTDISSKETRAVVASAKPTPHIQIEGIPGIITGTIKRYASSITGKKSDAMERSNGFFVNILGRVINNSDPYFGIEDLNHSVWSEFRMCVRADGLNSAIGVNREQLTESTEIAIFRSFLRSAFNLARREADSGEANSWFETGKDIDAGWGAIPLQSFRRSMRRFGENGEFPSSIIVPPGSESDVRSIMKTWDESTSQDPGNTISAVLFENTGPDRHLFLYDLAKRSIIVNLDHPFIRMHGKSEAEKKILKNIAVAETLSDSRLTDIGVSEELISDFHEYRDKLFRIVASIQRESGISIADQLMSSTSHEKSLEILVGDALEYLGFNVLRLASTGEPEGVALSPTASSQGNRRRPYSFTYDAKSTKHKTVKTKDLNVAALEHHRKMYDADYSLVVASDFQDGQLQFLCESTRVVPMRAEDLAKLLLLAAGTGPLDLKDFEALFDRTTVAGVSNWVSDTIKATLAEPRLQMADVLEVIEATDYADGAPISAQYIASKLQDAKKVKHKFTRSDVMHLFNGLKVLVPSLVITQNTDIYLGTSPDKFREALIQQINVIPAEFRFGLDVRS